ncbi:hypothetical protein [Pantoea agglomerans]|uniref:hypothetical protein n=1 Tax=Enterobacter agglomerans TaxID=549 RepID=UPI001780F8A5|nr:hypothetical protein [Pantoea agglomerans]MBD8132015.1 hypothetical protein [Pantoea agglomerans]
MKQQVLFDAGKATIATVFDCSGKSHYIRLDQVSMISHSCVSLSENLEEVEVACGTVYRKFTLNCDLTDDLLRAWFFVNGNNRPRDMFRE